MPSKSKKPKPQERNFLMVAIDPSLRAKFAKVAAGKNTTMSALVRKYVEKAVAP